MKTILIKNIKLQNFCGYSSAEFDFDDKETIIKAPSGYGKTTIIKAILFAFGFNVADIYPTIDGYKVANLQTAVELLVCANGYNYTLSVTSNQKWKTDKITNESAYIGNDIKYSFDGVISTLRDYKDKVANLWGTKYDYVEMLLNVAFFNTDTVKWKWTERRKFLYDILDIDSAVGSLLDGDDFNLIKEDIYKGKDEVDIQKTINAEKRAISQELEKNQLLIENKGNTVAELSSIDFSKWEQTKQSLGEEISKIQTNSTKVEDTDEYKSQMTALIDLEKSLDAETKAQEDAIRSRSKQSFAVELEINNTQELLSELKLKIGRLNSAIEDYDIEEIEIDRIKFDENSAVCPTCKRRYTEKKINELKKEFSAENDKRKSEIACGRAEAIVLRDDAISRANTLSQSLTPLKSKLDALRGIEYDYSKINKIEEEIKLQREVISKLKDNFKGEDNSARLLEAQKEYDDSIRELYKKTILDNTRAEIQSLKDQCKQLAIKDGIRIEKQNQLKDYIMKKVDIVNDTVNKNFEGVSFKFFELNGAEAENPLTDDCECVYNGKIYSSCSTGEKIYANMCVHKNLAKLCGVNCFLVVDDYNLCTFPFEHEGQIIKLFTTSDSTIGGARIDSIYTIDDCIK